jgi:hypothetical protein
MQFYNGSFFFVLINIFFRVTFICLLLLSILIFTHSTYTKPTERNMNSFYIPKLIIVFGLWCVTTISYIFSELHKIENPSYSFSEDFPYFKYVKLAGISFIGLYFAFIGYYLLRAKDLLLYGKYSIKFKVVWGMTIGLISGTVALFSLLSYLGKVNSAIILITFQVLFNAYPMVLATLFAPSTSKDTLPFDELSLTGGNDDVFMT